MTKSELIENLVAKNPAIPVFIVDNSVKEILEQITQALVAGQRVEIRGFGSFSLHYRHSRIGRNPKTGENVKLGSKYVPHFRAGKELKERVNIING
ncbi:integration host factor subunit beta [Nicoletella semolina]|uniref:Integration host factor subunit beta n=1 Tax=Nicoletella semolina TaxID=271160 RepID=A0A4R2N847_9PAST|nr:integration host factor subunit beta [Nicoletella semolina]MDH2923831.1 integration host factor subunit beta [Nicoletella semolina]TCP17143.1 integration host factor subunit beta [Nicoletella semolina]